MNITRKVLTPLIALAFLLIPALPAHAFWYGSYYGQQSVPAGNGWINFSLYFTGYDGGGRQVTAITMTNYGGAANFCVFDTLNGGAGDCAFASPAATTAEQLAVTSMDAYVYTRICHQGTGNCGPRVQRLLSR